MELPLHESTRVTSWESGHEEQDSKFVSHLQAELQKIEQEYCNLEIQRSKEKLSWLEEQQILLKDIFEKEAQFRSLEEQHVKDIDKCRQVETGLLKTINDIKEQHIKETEKWRQVEASLFVSIDQGNKDHCKLRKQFDEEIAKHKQTETRFLNDINLLQEQINKQQEDHNLEISNWKKIETNLLGNINVLEKKIAELEDQNRNLKSRNKSLNEFFDEAGVEEKPDKWKKSIEFHSFSGFETADTSEDDSIKKPGKFKPKARNEVRRSKKDLEVSKQLQLLLLETENLFESLREDVLLDPYDIYHMSSDNLKLLLEDLIQMKESKNDVRKLFTKIKQFQIKNGDRLTERQTRRIRNTMEKCDEFKREIQATKDCIIDEKKRRGIGNEYNGPTGEQPIFSGRPVPRTVFEFIRDAKEYMRRCNISFELYGAFLKNYCQGTAADMLKDHFQNNMEPKIEDVEQKLIEYFGDNSTIKDMIIKEHHKIGVIPEPISFDASEELVVERLNEIDQKVCKHIHLVKNSTFFKANEASQSEEFLDPYLLMLAEFLPTVERNSFLKRHHEHPSNKNKLDLIMKLLNEIKICVSSVIEEKMFLAENPDEECTEFDAETHSNKEESHSRDEESVTDQENDETDYEESDISSLSEYSKN